MSNTARSGSINNSILGRGGGVYVGMYADAVATIINSHFQNNQGAQGGGLYAVGGVNITGTIFISNVAADYGGGIVHRAYYSSGASARLVNSIFAHNRAANLTSPGLVSILHFTIASSNLTPGQAIAVLNGTVGITNSIITSHTVAISQTASASVYQDYNLFFGNSLTQTGVVVDGGHSRSGDPTSPTQASTTTTSLSPSAAIDAGVFASVTTDLDGHSRLPDYGGLRVDIGAYEAKYQGVIYQIYLPIISKNQ